MGDEGDGHGHGTAPTVLRIAKSDDFTGLATLDSTLAEGKLGDYRRARLDPCRPIPSAAVVAMFAGSRTRQNAITMAFGRATVRLSCLCCAGCRTTEACWMLAPAQLAPALRSDVLSDGCQRLGQLAAELARIVVLD